MEFLPKRMISWLVPDQRVDGLVEAVSRVNKTEDFGDDKIFICPLENVSNAGNAEAGTAP